MAVIQNKWVEKERKKKTHQTESSYESVAIDTKDPYNMKKPEKRSSVASRGTFSKTLRGNRK